MALKRKLSSAEFEALNETLRSEYTHNDKDGTYYLDVDDANELLGALERVREENKGNKELVASLNAQIDSAKDEIARKSGDIASIETGWKKKLSEKDKAHAAEIDAFKKVAIEGYLETLLSPVTDVFNLPKKHVKRDFAERIKVTFEDGRPVHKILNADGLESDMTIDDLQKEFVANGEYSQYIIQSRASGSTKNTGANQSGSAGNGSAKKYSEMTVDEKAEYLKQKHKHLQD